MTRRQAPAERYRDEPWKAVAIYVLLAVVGTVLMIWNWNDWTYPSPLWEGPSPPSP